MYISDHMAFGNENEGHDIQNDQQDKEKEDKPEIIPNFLYFGVNQSNGLFLGIFFGKQALIGPMDVSPGKKRILSFQIRSIEPTESEEIIRNAIIIIQISFLIWNELLIPLIPRDFRVGDCGAFILEIPIHQGILLIISMLFSEINADHLIGHFQIHEKLPISVSISEIKVHIMIHYSLYIPFVFQIQIWLISKLKIVQRALMIFVQTKSF